MLLKKSKVLFCILCIIVLQNCISTFRKVDVQPALETHDITLKDSCVQIKNLVLVELGPALDSKHLIDMTDISYKNEKSVLNLAFNSTEKIRKECSRILDANINLVVKAKKDNIFWPLMSLITVGIVPYWDDYENLMEVELYDKGVFQKKINSQINYSQIYSLFLLPVMPFYDNVYSDFNDKILNKHAVIIKKNFKD